MNRIVWILLMASFSNKADAARFEVYGESPLFSVEVSVEKGESIAQVTKRNLSRAKDSGLIDAFGFGEVGVDFITPLRGLPLGFSVEHVSARELRAFGWCYSVDGVTPELLADEYKLLGTEEKIRWYFGYASRIDQNWEAQCIPVFTP
ncbi:MAG: hypothetical protein KGP28_03635 [Bdellovibrionales bacterium]|nr:hypothetical protein [Bdellovibrionales bacterium]